MSKFKIGDKVRCVEADQGHWIEVGEIYTVKYVAPNAKAANVSIEDTAAMMAILADNGIKGSMAGTSLRKIMTDLAGTGGDLTQKLSELSKENLNLADASDEVGRNAQTAFLVLLDNMEKLPGLSEEFKNSGGAAEEMARIMGDTLTGDVDRLGGAWDSFMLSLDDTLELPELCDTYVAGDVGVKDLTAYLFGYYDFEKATLCILDEYISNGLS